MAPLQQLQLLAGVLGSLAPGACGGVPAAVVALGSPGVGARGLAVTAPRFLPLLRDEVRHRLAVVVGGIGAAIQRRVPTDQVRMVLGEPRPEDLAYTWTQVQHDRRDVRRTGGGDAIDE